MNDAGARQFVTAMVENLMPEGGASSTVETWMENEGPQGVLRIHTVAADAIQSITAEMISPLGMVNRMNMQPMGDGYFQQTIPMDGSGKYMLNLTLINGDSIQDEQTAVAVSYSTEYEAFPEEESRQLLDNRCQLPEGRLWRI